MEKNISFKLKIWRQRGPKEKEMRKQAGLAVDAKILCEVVVMDVRVSEM